MRLIRNLAQGIKNLFYYFPVIWTDRHWDEYYLFLILRHKLKAMEGFFRSKEAWAASASQTADKIKTCVTLLDRIIEDEYHETAFAEHYRKWGEPSMKFIDTDRKELKQLLIEYPNIKTEADNEQQTKEFLTCSEREEHLRKQDISYLFEMIAKHVRCWWD